MIRQGQKSLAIKMLALSVEHPDRADELTEKAKAFDAATRGFYANPPTVSTKQFLGAWARARKLYAEITGDPLVL